MCREEAESRRERKEECVGNSLLVMEGQTLVWGECESLRKRKVCLQEPRTRAERDLFKHFSECRSHVLRHAPIGRRKKLPLGFLSP